MKKAYKSKPTIRGMVRALYAFKTSSFQSVVNDGILK